VKRQILNFLSFTGYGDSCNEDVDCYGAFSYESMSCDADKCDCSEGYYLVGSSYCRREGESK